MSVRPSPAPSCPVTILEAVPGGGRVGALEGSVGGVRVTGSLPTEDVEFLDAYVTSGGRGIPVAVGPLKGKFSP